MLVINSNFTLNEAVFQRECDAAHSQRMMAHLMVPSLPRGHTNCSKCIKIYQRCNRKYSAAMMAKMGHVCP